MNIAYVIPIMIKIFLQKKSIMFTGLFISGAFTALVEFLTTHIKTDEHQITITSLTFLSFVSIVFIFIDFIFGILASRAEKQSIVSSKIGITASKMLCVFLFFFLALVVLVLISDNYFVLTLVYGPIVLTILKEFTSVGENIERIYGRKLYFFVIMDRMFELLEMKFFKSIEDKEIPQIEEIINQNNNNEQTTN